MLKRISDLTPIIINKVGTEGKRGERGKDGITTIVEKIVELPSAPGEPGKDGIAPEHEVVGGRLRFKNPDGSWGKWLEPRATGGGGGGASTVAYYPVRQAVYRIAKASIIEGNNIIGVDYAGDVIIYLPDSIEPTMLFSIKDESNNAGTYNITITTET